MDSKIGLRDTADANSNTLLVGERDYRFHNGVVWQGTTNNHEGNVNRHWFCPVRITVDPRLGQQSGAPWGVLDRLRPETMVSLLKHPSE